MHRVICTLAVAALTACSASSERHGKDIPTTPIEAAIPDAGEMVIVADAVAWPARLKFCPISAEGVFETNCPRSVDLPVAPGETNSAVGELFDLGFGPRTVGRQRRTFSRAVGEVFSVHPSRTPASARYALVYASDPRGTVGGRRVSVRSATYVFDARPDLVMILSAGTPPLANAETERHREIETVRRLLPRPGYAYETMTKVRVECNRTGILYGGDGKERCRIIEGGEKPS